MERYRTVLREAETEFTERRSRFIGRAGPVRTEEEAADFIRGVRAAHRGATHNVYAYALRAGQTRRFSDDGEPQGTAGIPALDALARSGVTDTAVVVTRYFGGILLGTGGLVRAYSHGASAALDAAGIAVMGLCCELSASCDYSQYGRVAPLIASHGGAVDASAFADRVELRFHIPCESFDAFRAALADRTCGACSAEQTGKKYYRIA